VARAAEGSWERASTTRYLLSENLVVQVLMVLVVLVVARVVLVVLTVLSVVL
jgi:hypothetical protein